MTAIEQAPAAAAPEEKIQRFRPGQRYVHLLVAVSFVVLFLSGLPLIWSPLSFLAAGGYTRIIHRIAAVGFMAVPILYFIVDRKGAKELIVDSFSYDRDDLRWLLSMGQYFLGNAHGMPPQGRLNAGQKLHHAAVIVLSAGVVFSGLALWFLTDTLGPAGLGWALTVHNVTMLILVLLLVGHIYFTVVYKAILAMHTGYVSRADAALEHPKWVAELEGREFDPAAHAAAAGEPAADPQDAADPHDPAGDAPSRG